MTEQTQERKIRKEHEGQLVRIFSLKGYQKGLKVELADYIHRGFLYSFPKKEEGIIVLDPALTAKELGDRALLDYRQKNPNPLVDGSIWKDDAYIRVNGRRCEIETKNVDWYWSKVDFGAPSAPQPEWLKHFGDITKYDPEKIRIFMAGRNFESKFPRTYLDRTFLVPQLEARGLSWDELIEGK